MFLQQPQGTSPRKRAASCHPARNRRGCLIANPTLPGKKNPTFQNQPVFSCVLAAASVSTRVYTRYQTDNRRRQRHRVRKAVFVQLIRICPKAFADVVRAGQCAVILTNLYPRPTRLNLPQMFHLMLQRVIVARSSSPHQTVEVETPSFFADFT